MDLVDVYSALQKKEITTEDAATALKMPVRTMKFRISRWGHRLPLLLSVLDKLRRNEVTRGESAEALQVSPREVNHLMQSWNVHRPIPQYLVLKATAGVKWELRKKFAIDYISGNMTIEDAADGAHVSARQMRRWVAELLKKHFGMAFKDLKTLSLKQRGRLSDEIETAENLELAKQNVLNAISSGKRDIHDEAFDRVTAKRKRREG